MSQASAASMFEWDVNNPPDSPLAADPNLTEGLAIPTDHVRRMEEAQRVFAIHNAQQMAYAHAHRQAMWTVGTQCVWLGVGGWLFARGYRYADPVQSLASGWTSNRFLCRAFTPLPMLGLLIGGVTLFQLPSDVRLLTDARVAWGVEEAQKETAMTIRTKAYLDGKNAADHIKAEEEKAFEANMASTAKGGSK